MLDDAYMFSLTPLTRNASQDRRITVQGFDLNRRHFFLALMGFPVGAILAASFWGMFGSYALLFTMFWYIALFWFVETRTSTGLRLRRYQALIDSKTSNTGQFVLCGAEVNPGESRETKILSASVPVTNRNDEVDVHGSWTDPTGLFTTPAASH